NTYDLILLDINLPDGNGLAFLTQIREKVAAKIVMLTANDMETDVVSGLEMGADDYITKPFSLAILRARVNTQLRKAVIHRVQIDNFIFDFDKMEFYKKDVLIDLSKTEQKLLRLLVDSKGITLSRDKLLESIWIDGADFVDENALSVTIKRLRDKLEDTPAKPEYIKTVYGLGYTWVVK
ncbi:MAG: response regulator transcription factor, partial [Oscillospiraceae bacterium]